VAAPERTYAVLGRHYQVRFPDDASIEPFSDLLPEAAPPTAAPRIECVISRFQENGFQATVGTRLVGPERSVHLLAIAFEHAVVRDALGSDGPPVLHAAAVTFAHRAVLLPGRSGSGKTTLAVAMCLRGGRLLSDEIVLASQPDGCVSGYPRTICIPQRDRDALLAPLDKTGILTRLKRLGEASLLLPKLLNATGQPGRLSTIVFPSFHPDSQPALTSLSPGQAAARLLGSLYPRGTPSQRLAAAARLASGVPCYDLRTGALEPTLELLSRALRLPLSGIPR
jgi:hypothetical protein